jgi:hypothetical protein
MSGFQPDQSQEHYIKETPYLIRGGDPDRGSVPQKPAPPGLLLVQVVKNGGLLIKIREKVDPALHNTILRGGALTQPRTSRKGPIQANIIGRISN